MTSRQTIQATQRNSSYKGRTSVGIDSSTHAIMVHIAWTNAPVVRIQARAAFNLDCQIVSVVRGSYTIVRQSVNMNIAEGKVLHFVASGREGFYYLVQTIANESRCSCPAHHNPKSTSCKHLDAVQVYCEQAEQREFEQAGQDAKVELVEVERAGYIYPMYKIVSPTYQGRLHYTWTEQHSINRFPVAGSSVIHEIEEAVESARFQQYATPRVGGFNMRGASVYISDAEMAEIKARVAAKHNAA